MRYASIALVSKSVSDYIKSEFVDDELLGGLSIDQSMMNVRHSFTTEGRGEQM